MRVKQTHKEDAANNQRAATNAAFRFPLKERMAGAEMMEVPPDAT